jgi:hypothetical protein
VYIAVLRAVSVVPKMDNEYGPTLQEQVYMGHPVFEKFNLAV